MAKLMLFQQSFAYRLKHALWLKIIESFLFEISENSIHQYKNKPRATYTQTVIVQNEYSENELDTNESRNTTRCQSCNVWINLDGSFVDNPVVSGRTVIITFPKVIIPVTFVALFFLGSWFN